MSAECKLTGQYGIRAYLKGSDRSLIEYFPDVSREGLSKNTTIFLRDDQ